ncbi:MAG TPA: D-glycero-beta-D-manno-heptose 1-phosphate adenylyltransferase [Bacteroidaceae bacterium]|nr:D-glycero-beta-D-manno-heptose 1-phosphate adenylyltransferase [Bacteroidaceae bacterium]
MHKDILNKILTAGKLEKILNREFRSTHKIAFTNGCFDLLHRGHIYYLALAKEKADILVIGLNSDNSVKRLKGPDRPVMDQQTRAEILAAMQFVDFVIIFDEDTPLSLIKKIKPDFLIKGGDYKIKEIAGYEAVKSYGGVIETIPLLDGYSSSELIKRIK